MKKKLQDFLFNFTKVLEIVLSILLIVIIFIFMIKLGFELSDFSSYLSQPNAFDQFISELMALAIGVELIKMLCIHTPESIAEVLLFAIARSIVVSHSSGTDTLLGVICIVLLFATRKYLFLSKDIESADSK